MAGDNINPELARIIARLQDRIRVLESRNPPVGARNLNDLDDVYINVLSRVDRDLLTWFEDGQYWTNNRPATFDWFEAFNTAAGGFTNNTNHDIDWVVNSAKTSGTNIAVNAGLNVEIYAAGIYAVNATFGALADTAADTYSQYLGFLDIGVVGTGRDSIILTDRKYPELRAVGKHGGWSGMTYVGFLPVGTIIKVTMNMIGDAGVTWSFDGGNIQVNQIG